jgi:hypothetical protein
LLDDSEFVYDSAAAGGEDGAGKFGAFLLESAGD